MNAIELKDKYEENLEVIEKLKELLTNASENYKKVILESIDKVKEENNEICKRLRVLQYRNISKKDFINLMKQDKKKVNIKKEKKEIEIPDNKKEIVVEADEINKIVTDIKEIPYVEEKPTVIYEPKVIRKPKEVKEEVKQNDDITEVLTTDRISSEKLRDAKVVFDGTYKIIYDDGKGIYEQDIYEFLLDYQSKDDRTVYNFNIIKILKDFDEKNGSNLYYRYMENHLPVEYNFDYVKTANYNRKLIDGVKKIATRESQAFKNVTCNDNRRKVKFRRGLVAAAAVGLLALSSLSFGKFGSKSQANKTNNGSNIEASTEVIETTTEARDELANNEALTTTDNTGKRYKLSDIEDYELLDRATTNETYLTYDEYLETKAEIAAMKQHNESLEVPTTETPEENYSFTLGDTVSFDNVDLYYASTDETPRGNTKYIKGDYEYKATMISVVYKNQVMELVYNDKINLEELEKVCKEKYGDDVKISINFDLMDKDGNVVTKYVGWVNESDVKTLSLK